MRLLDRSSHRGGLAGSAFLVETRQILAHVDRAAKGAGNAAGSDDRSHHARGTLSQELS